MRVSDNYRDWDFEKVMKEIRASDLAEAEKVARAFDLVTSQIVENGQREIELARAMKDQDSVVKEQIKLSMMCHARGVFRECFKRMTGKEAWDE
jgi:hypothetical protein